MSRIDWNYDGLQTMMPFRAACSIVSVQVCYISSGVKFWCEEQFKQTSWWNLIVWFSRWEFPRVLCFCISFFHVTFVRGWFICYMFPFGWHCLSCFLGWQVMLTFIWIGIRVFFETNSNISISFHNITICISHKLVKVHVIRISTTKQFFISRIPISVITTIIRSKECYFITLSLIIIIIIHGIYHLKNFINLVTAMR